MKRVVLGLSGGVDSAVAGYLLKEQGYEVIGVFMKNWEEQDENQRCTSDEDYGDAKAVAKKLDIPFYSVNYSKTYWDKVFTYFLESFKKGRTPNPDVLCNKEVKFGDFLKFAKSIGGEFVATGHYAGTSTIDGEKYIKKGSDKNKDQSYFLNQLSKEQAEMALFPLAMIEKPKVREIAEKLGLSVATKKDSTGICFIGERNFRNFLTTYLPAQEGEIRTLDERVVGKHVGLMHYTLGQRRGLDIGGLKGFSGRWFVIKKDLEKNVLYVQNGEGEELVSTHCKCENFNFITKPFLGEFSALAKFRYREADLKVSVKSNGKSVEIFYPQGDRAVTPGQYAVLYADESFGKEFEDVMLGGGEIDFVEKI